MKNTNQANTRLQMRLYVALVCSTLGGCTKSRVEATKSPLPQNNTYRNTSYIMGISGSNQTFKKKSCLEIFEALKKEPSLTRNWIRFAFAATTHECDESYSKLENDDLIFSDPNQLLLAQLALTKKIDTTLALTLNQELVNGTFFKNASTEEQSLLRTLYCKPLAQLLSTIPPETLVKTYHISYLTECVDREARRKMLIQRKANVGVFIKHLEEFKRQMREKNHQELAIHHE